jgi:hypothetical protein
MRADKLLVEFFDDQAGQSRAAAAELGQFPDRLAD